MTKLVTYLRPSSGRRRSGRGVRMYEQGDDGDGAKQLDQRRRQRLLQDVAQIAFPQPYWRLHGRRPAS